MKRTGNADLPLHGGRVPYWLASRMEKLGGAIAETIIEEYGRQAFLDRICDPSWFQAFGCVLGMDWHSSGITTSVMGALRRAFEHRQQHLGLRVFGGRGKASRRTPSELENYAEQKGLNGDLLIRSSKLSAKVDNTAIQDGYQLYLHSFLVDERGEWAVIQQGMHKTNGMARRYHWRSSTIKDFTCQPHAAIAGIPGGKILNLTSTDAQPTKTGILELINEKPEVLSAEVRKIIMPKHHDVRSSNVNLKRLGAVLALAYDRPPEGFDELLLIPGLGPRTLQSLVLVSEVIHGTPVRFEDPARYSFAHGGKDGHPFPVPTRVYDNTIAFMDSALQKSRIDRSDKRKALRRLHQMSVNLEKDIIADKTKFSSVVSREWEHSKKWHGKTAGKVEGPPCGQLSLFN